MPHLRHVEYFYDHVRIERMLFDGAIEPVNGILYPDLSRPGIGLVLKERDARKFARMNQHACAGNFSVLRSALADRLDQPLHRIVLCLDVDRQRILAHGL